MEFIIELVLELFVEGGIEVSSNKKISKCIRYPILALLILFFSVVIFGIIILGVLMLKENILVGILFIALGLFFLVISIHKFRKRYLEVTNKK